ncbi:splicing factor, partial [Coemansia sp. RSA 2607]
LLPFVTESPKWLLSKNRREEANGALQSFRQNADIKLEFEYMLEVSEQSKRRSDDVTVWQVLRGRTPDNLNHQLLCVCITKILQQLSGVNAISFYSTAIINKSTRETLKDSPTLAQILTFAVSAVGMLTVFVCMPLGAHVGRRTLLINSHGALAVVSALLVVGSVRNIPALVVTMVFLFNACFNFGTGPVPWTIAAELTPRYAMTAVSAIGNAIGYTFVFTVGLIFPPMQAALGNYTFLFFMAWNVVATVFALLFIPETKDRLLEENVRAHSHGIHIVLAAGGASGVNSPGTDCSESTMLADATTAMSMDTPKRKSREETTSADDKKRIPIEQPSSSRKCRSPSRSRSPPKYRRDRHSYTRSRSRSHSYRRASRSRTRYSPSRTRRSRSRTRHSRSRRNSIRSPSPSVDEASRDLRTVFAMQLSASLRRSDLVDFFSEAGRVRDAKIVAEKGSRRSRGVAYVEFYEIESAANAVNLTGKRLLGVPIIVQPSEAQKNRQSTTKQYKADGAPVGVVDGTLLYVENLLVDIEPDDLQAFFYLFGKVEYCRVFSAEVAEWAAFVKFDSSAPALMAIEKLNDLELFGTRLRVRVARRSEQEREALKIAERKKKHFESLETNLVANHASPSVLSPSVDTSEFCVLKLGNMFDPREESDAGDSWMRDIEEDVGGECAGFGSVEGVRIEQNRMATGSVLVRFSDIKAAAAAQKAMNLRWFGGRQISATLVPDSQWPANKLS